MLIRNLLLILGLLVLLASHEVFAGIDDLEKRPDVTAEPEEPAVPPVVKPKTTQQQTNTDGKTDRENAPPIPRQKPKRPTPSTVTPEQEAPEPPAEEPPESDDQADAPIMSEVDSSLKKRRVPKIPDIGKGNQESDDCNSMWNRVRSKRVVKRPLDVAKIRANAKGIKGLDMNQLERAMATYAQNQDKIPNQKTFGFIDFRKSSSERRMYLVDPSTGQITPEFVAHGIGSDDGSKARRANKFGNEGVATYKSSLGCGLFNGQFPDGQGRPALRFFGFESGKNNRSCVRAVFMHVEDYVPGGRSHGCQAVEGVCKASRKVWVRNKKGKKVQVSQCVRWAGHGIDIMNRLDGGSMVCSYGN